nr:hypothetical protein [Planococcus glaciei]
MYIGHKKETVRPPFYADLQNEFVYLSSEEEQTTKIYFRYMERLNELVGNYFIQLIRKETSGQNFWRRKPKDLVPEVPREILASLKNDFREGALISLADPEKQRTRLNCIFGQSKRFRFWTNFGQISGITQNRKSLAKSFSTGKRSNGDNTRKRVLFFVWIT